MAWLEEKYHEKPCCKIALAISLHYLLLALRHDPTVESDIALDYCARAARWSAKAFELSTIAQAVKANHEN